MNTSMIRPLFGFAIALAAASCTSATTEAPTTTTTNPKSEKAVMPSTTAESNKRVMERFTREFLPTGDAALAEQFLSPDVVIHFAGQQQRGRDTYLGLVAANRKAFPDLVWTVDQMVADGDTVAIRYTMTGTQRGTFAGVPATGKSVTAQSMAFYHLVNGKIVEERAQLDMLAVLQQIGAIPTP
ncbi:ester cyclase [Burkholderia pseudomallei]